MRIAAEDRRGADAALLRGHHAGLAGGAICIAGIDQRNPEMMLAPFQVALSNDERRSDHFVAGEHRGGGRRLIGHCAGKVRITAGLEAGAHSSEGEAARHLVVAEGSVQRRRWGAGDVSAIWPLLYQENAPWFTKRKARDATSG